jgi:hypothetical protein
MDSNSFSDVKSLQQGGRFQKWKRLLAQIQEHNYFPKYSHWILAAFLISFSIIYSYHEILFKPAQSIHLWRQCDCLSITMNYYQDNNPFFEPTVHNLGRDGTGKTVSECPIIYYTIAQLWKVFGHHEFIFRLVVLLLFFTSLFVLFKTFEDFLRESILSMIGILFLFTSPTLIYYANNFLMDIPAFSLAVIGFSFFIRFVHCEKQRWFYWSMFFYSLAGLLKISSLLSFGAIFGLFWLEVLGVKVLPNRKIFIFPLQKFLLLLGVIGIQVAWYIYASQYNSQYNSGNFLIGTLPIWKMNRIQIMETLHAIDYHINWDYFRQETQVVFVLLFALLLLFYKRGNNVLRLLTIITVMGFLAFIFLFFDALKDHDYYTINLFILVPIMLLAFLLLLKDRFPTVFNSAFFWILSFSFLVHNVDFGRRRMSDRYSNDGWHNESYVTYFQTFRKIPYYLRSIGITQDDKVLSISDNSINISLYMMNQKGWTNYGTKTNSATIRKRILQGAKYLFISNQADIEEVEIKPFLTKKIGQYKNVDIFELDSKQ